MSHHVVILECDHSHYPGHCDQILKFINLGGTKKGQGGKNVMCKCHSGQYLSLHKNRSLGHYLGHGDLLYFSSDEVAYTV